MKTNKIKLSVVFITMLTYQVSFSDTMIVVPGDFETNSGTGGFNTLIRDEARTYQVQISESRLMDLIGLSLTGFSTRLSAANTSNWPSAPRTWANYDIVLSPAANHINDFSSNFANNMSDPLQVRSGSLTIDGNSFPRTLANPNPWGPLIQFDSPYLYSGGDLVMEVRHTGNGIDTLLLDAIESSAVNGYIARSASSYTASFSGSADFTILQFHAIPEPSTILMVVLTGMVFGIAPLYRRLRGRKGRR
ncbi:MAG: hypothetical protein JJU05_07510 [Verrucomicrobia bacterium]|nr:hypothetical protein [Verrucomicrobiota bacterium]MCH8527773.1 hypothetical protein [Kiritimatiellia bacterium]